MNFSGNIKRSTIFYYLVIFLFFSIPLSQHLSSKLLLLAVIFLFFVSDRFVSWRDLLRNSWDLFLFYFVSVVGLLYSDYINSGLSVLETRLSFIALPIVFWKLRNVRPDHFNIALNSMTCGVSVASAVCIGHSLFLYSKTNNLEVFLYNSLTYALLGFQPTYFAYFLVFGITYLLYKLFYQDNEGIIINSVLISALVLFLFGTLMLTGGYTAIISLLFIFSFFLLKFIVDEKTRSKRVSFYLILLMLSVMFSSKLMGTKSQNSALNDSWERFIIWESVINAMPDIFLGVGTGGSKAVLDDYYLQHGLEKYANKGYNSHNQFIQLLFSNGILGLGSLVILLGRPLYRSVKSNSTISIILIFPFLIYGITEVFLGRYQGIVFYVVLHQLILWNSNSQNNEGQNQTILNSKVS